MSENNMNENIKNISKNKEVNDLIDLINKLWVLTKEDNDKVKGILNSGKEDDAIILELEHLIDPRNPHNLGSGRKSRNRKSRNRKSKNRKSRKTRNKNNNYKKYKK